MIICISCDLIKSYLQLQRALYEKKLFAKYQNLIISADVLIFNIEKPRLMDIMKNHSFNGCTEKKRRETEKEEKTDANLYLNLIFHG